MLTSHPQSDNLQPVNNKEKQMTKESAAIINAINEITTKGTRIVSFTYRGKYVENTLVGSNEAARVISNSSLVQNKYSRAICGYKKDSPLMLLAKGSNKYRKLFSLYVIDEITDFSAVRSRHFDQPLTFLDRLEMRFRGWKLALSL